jgi:hypothetical protein
MDCLVVTEVTSARSCQHLGLGQNVCHINIYKSTKTNNIDTIDPVQY